MNIKIKTILERHSKWARHEDDGERADLRRANLSGADLSGADLSGANLSGADLRRANLRVADLRRADLSGADLRGADLSGADLTDTILNSVNWMAYLGLVADANGSARAYKMTTADGKSPMKSPQIDYAGQTTFEAQCDPDVFQYCSNGINLGTLQWCLANKLAGYRLFLMQFRVADAVCPVASYGKFRVSKCEKVCECDWNGNMLEVSK
jgi:hypothetical protein